MKTIERQIIEKQDKLINALLEKFDIDLGNDPDQFIIKRQHELAALKSQLKDEKDDKDDRDCENCDKPIPCNLECEDAGQVRSAEGLRKEFEYEYSYDAMLLYTFSVHEKKDEDIKERSYYSLKASDEKSAKEKLIEITDDEIDDVLLLVTSIPFEVPEYCPDLRALSLKAQKAQPEIDINTPLFGNTGAKIPVKAQPGDKPKYSTGNPIIKDMEGSQSTADIDDDRIILREPDDLKHTFLKQTNDKDIESWSNDFKIECETENEWKDWLADNILAIFHKGLIIGAKAMRDGLIPAKDKE